MSNMLHILGAQLGQVIGKQEGICRGMLRITITDNVKTLNSADPRQILAYINTMTYDDWKMVLESPVMSQRLTAIGIKDPAAVVSQLKRTLVNKQSLLTISMR